MTEVDSFKDGLSWFHTSFSGFFSDAGEAEHWLSENADNLRLMLATMNTMEAQQEARTISECRL